MVDVLPPQGINMPPYVDYTSWQAGSIKKKTKRGIFYPTGSSNISLGPDSESRFEVKSQDFLDPYSLQLKFTVQIDSKRTADATSPYDPTDVTKSKNLWHKCWQVDNSAQSFIRQLRVSNGPAGSDLERIDSYDIIAALLNDLCTQNPGSLRSVDYSGVGGMMGSHFTNQTFNRTPPPFYNSTTGATLTGGANDPHTYTINTNASGTIGTNAEAVPALFFDPARCYNYAFPLNINGGESVLDQNGEPTAAQGNYPDMFAPLSTNFPNVVSNILYGASGTGIDTIWGDGYQFTGIGSTNAVTQIKVGGAFLNSGGPTGATVTCPNKSVTNNLWPWDTIRPNTAGNANATSTVMYNNVDLADNFDIGRYGHQNPYPQNFGKTTMEPVFSGLVQKVINNGVPGVKVLDTQTFIIPVLSGTIGHLMPLENYKLIPLVGFTDGLSISFVFNPHALFTSFYSANLSDRSYTIIAIELQADLYEFNSLPIIDATNKALLSGFTIMTQSFSMCHTESLNNQDIPRSISINAGYDSMRSFLMLLLADDYKDNCCYRKQYRLSGGITSLQLKLGVEYYPPQPITGNAGCNFGQRNNYDFYLMLLKCFGKNNAREDIGINVHNYALNWREAKIAIAVGEQLVNQTGYLNNPNTGKASNSGGRTVSGTDTNTAIEPGYDLIQANNYGSTPALCVNGGQYTFFLENRCIGKAAFGIPCVSSLGDPSSMDGKNTTLVRPFNIQVSQEDSFKGSYRYLGPSTLWCFVNYDKLLIFKDGKVYAAGQT